MVGTDLDLMCSRYNLISMSGQKVDSVFVKKIPADMNFTVVMFVLAFSLF